MGVQIETERRFLCDAVPAGARADAVHLQSYLVVLGPLEIRVRTSTPPDGGPGTSTAALKFRLGASRRVEIETTVPERLATLAHRRSRSLVRKTRHLLPGVDGTWEIDRYEGRHHGLVTAELELSPATSPQLPSWLGREVTGQDAYSNRTLARRGLPGDGPVPPRPAAATVTAMTTPTGPARNAVRATAALSTVVLAAGAALLVLVPALAPVLLGVQTLVFATGWLRPAAHPYRVPAAFLAPRFGTSEPEHPLPVRFASLAGTFVTAGSFLAALSGQPALAVGFAVVATAAAAANAFADWCAACVLYPRVRRVVDPLLRAR